jgi:acetoin utilization deacetylase AcuC-like enzyme
LSLPGSTRIAMIRWRNWISVEEDFAWITHRLCDCRAPCGRAAGFVLEGGYDLGALGRSWPRISEVLMEKGA